MGKYTDYSMKTESKDNRVLEYKNLRFSGDAMVYGTDGQAAYKARPVEVPQTEEQQVHAPEVEYRPMPSAVMFEDVGHVARRRRAPRAVSAAVYIFVTLVAATVLFGLIQMLGEINSLTIRANDLVTEITELQKAETKLNYRINSQMTELQMLDYAENVLLMENASASDTVNMDFGYGDRYEIGKELGESDTLFGHFTSAVKTFINYIG